MSSMEETQELEQEQQLRATQQSSASFRDFEEVLFEGGLETLPFEFGCDFGTNYEDKQVLESATQRDNTTTTSPQHTTTSKKSLSSSSETTIVTKATVASELSSVTLVGAQVKLESKSLSTSNDSSKKRIQVVVTTDKKQVDQIETEEKTKPKSVHEECTEANEKVEEPEDEEDDMEEEEEAIEENKTNGAKPPAPISCSATKSSSSSSQTQIGRWTKREHELFLEGLKLYGKSWKKISNLVVTRTLVQIRTHAQKYLQKQSKTQKAMLAAAQATAVQNQHAAMKYHQQLQHQQQQQQQQQQRAAAAAAAAVMSGGYIAPANHPYFTPDAYHSHAHANAQLQMYHLHPMQTEAQEAIPSKLDQLLHEEADFFSPTGTDDDIYTPSTFPMGMETHFSAMDHMKRSQDAMKIMSQLKPIAPSHPTAVAVMKRRRLEPMMVPRQQQPQQQQLHHSHAMLSGAMVDPMMNGGYGMYMNMNPTTMMATNDLQFASTATSTGPYDVMSGHQFPDDDTYRWM